MKKFLRSFSVVLLIVLASMAVFSQDDEMRQATGLPMKIGENSTPGDRMNVTGRITLETTEKPKRQPVITVSVIVGGIAADKSIANDRGYYFIRNVPRVNATIIVDIDGNEVVHQPILSSAMGNARLDYSVPWPRSLNVRPGVITANQFYSRSEKNEELLRKALTAERTNDTAKAMEFLNQILVADPKDFVAWTEVGTLYFRGNSLDNAEGCYFKAIELKKDYFPALLNLGKLYVQRKQFDSAILVLTNAVKTVPDSADAHYYLGETYLQSKKGSLAVQQLNEAIKLDPLGMAEIHLRLAFLYDAAGVKDRAAAEYKMFLEKRPDYVDKQKLEAYIKTNPPK